MFTVKVGDKEQEVFQFGDLLVGDIFVAERRIFVKTWDKPDFWLLGENGYDNAIDLQHNCGKHFDNSDIVEPIMIEFGFGGDEDQDRTD